MFNFWATVLLWPQSAISATASAELLLGHRLGDVLIDLLKSGVSVRPYVLPSVRPQSLYDFALIWCVGRPRPDMCTRVTSTRSKVKELLKFQKLHFSRSISSAIFGCSSKLMVDGDTMGPGLQLV